MVRDQAETQKKMEYVSKDSDSIPINMDCVTLDEFPNGPQKA